MGSTPVRIRWKTAEDEARQQAALFADDELVDRHVGTGEFRGLEFIHVNAKRIINEVPGQSRMPFRYTINAYRGCSHACTYCVGADTPVLMADGRYRPVADLRVGEAIYGTERVGAYRRFVRSQVLAHWETVRQAYRVVLAGGTELVASGDHRFLTNRGWKHVADGTAGSEGRPHLAVSDDLLGTGTIRAGSHLDGRELRYTPDLRVVAIEPVGVALPMYDITTSTGDFVANGVVSHNCFARPTHDYLGMNIGEDFDRRLVVKVNAVERLAAELRSPRWQGEGIAMGTNTDPYQRAEGKYHLTQGIVRVLGEHRNPFSILTKSTLILRDLDLLVRAAHRTDVRVNFSIASLDERHWKQHEPGTPHPRRRVEAVRRLNDAGIRCGVLMAPILPGISDRPEQLAETVEACVDAGAVSIGGMPLHLRGAVKGHFLEALSRTDPELVAEYRRLYTRAYLPKATTTAVSEQIRDLVREARRRSDRRNPPPIAATSGRGVGPPRRTPQPPLPGPADPVAAPDQLALDF